MKEDMVISFVEDIMKYAWDNDIGEYKTNQQYVGMKELFHGYVVKDWDRVEFNMNKYHELNRIIAKKWMEYYVIY